MFPGSGYSIQNILYHVLRFLNLKFEKSFPTLRITEVPVTFREFLEEEQKPIYLCTENQYRYLFDTGLGIISVAELKPFDSEPEPTLFLFY